MKNDQDQAASDMDFHDHAPERLKAQKWQTHPMEVGAQNEDFTLPRAEAEVGLESYSVLYDYAPVGYFIIDRDGAICQVNLTGARLLGMDRARLVNHRFGLFISEADQPAFNAFLQKAFDSKSKEVFEAALLKEKTDSLWVHIEALASEDQQECRAVVVDITERKRAEETLQLRAEELAALNSLGQAVNATLSLEEAIMAALQGMLNAVHPDMAFFFLRENDRLLVKQVAPLSAQQRLKVIPEHRVGECMCGLAAQEKKPIYSLNIFKDPRCSWDECKKAGVKSFAALPLNHGDEIIGVIGLASDTERDYERQAGFLETLASQISVALANARLFEIAQRELVERKRVEEALRRSEEHFRALIEHSSDMIFVVDKEGTNTYVSPSVEHVLGYKSEDLIGKSYFYIILPADVPKAIHDFGEAILTREVVIPNSFRVLHQDGSERALEGVGKNLLHNPSIAGFVMNVRDITERKKAEEALKDQMDELRRWHEVTLGRETRVLDLKREVNELLAKLGQPSCYASVAANEWRNDRNEECEARKETEKEPPHEKG